MRRHPRGVHPHPSIIAWMSVAATLACAPPPSPPDGGLEDGGLEDAARQAPTDASEAACTPLPESWDAALRGRDPSTVSVVVAPGRTWVDLRDALASGANDPTLMSLEAGVRRRASGAPPSVEVGDTAAYQSLASYTLAKAWVGFLDEDAATAEVALAALQTAAVPLETWRGQTEVPIRVGASLVPLAAATELIGVTAPDRYSDALAALSGAFEAVIDWYRNGGDLFLAAHYDNHGVRYASGVLVAGLLTPPSSETDAEWIAALAHLARTIDDSQTGGRGVWSEGPFYLSYAMEVGPEALAALDAVWEGPDILCLRCPTASLASCARTDVPLHRPSRNPVLTELARWLGHIETAGGWLAPFDDARPTGWVAPPFEALVDLRTSTAWGPSVRGALGGSVRTDPIVIAAVALSPAERPSASPVEWLGGVAHLRGTDGTGSDAREALLIAEDDFSANGNGHERADPLSVVLGLGGQMLVGPSGYERWSTRAVFQPSEQSSVVTMEAVLPRRDGPQQVPGTTPATTTDGASATFSHEGLSWTRTVVQTATGWTVRDALSLDDSHPDEGRIATWHWHLRGEVTSDDGAETLSWTLDDVDCELRISGETSAWRVDSAAHSDDGTEGATHPVLRFEAVVRSEPTELEAEFVCGRAR